MKILVGIPVLTGPDHCKEAIESAINGADVLVIDNGSGPEMMGMLSKLSKQYDARLIIRRNEDNIYVNPAWNQIIEFFLSSDFEHLIIMNSDLVLCQDWYNVVVEQLSLGSIPVPVISSNKTDLKVKKQAGYWEVFEGTPGVFISLTREQAKLIYPIPDKLKVWFGDNWIYENLRKAGYRTIINNKLVTYHSWSQTVSKVPGISEIIEQDKIEWAKLNGPKIDT